MVTHKGQDQPKNIGENAIQKKKHCKVTHKKTVQSEVETTIVTEVAPKPNPAKFT
jgi:hypothetical protein